MDKLTVRKGATLPLVLTMDDEDAVTAKLIVKEAVADVTPAITVEANFVDGEADLTIPATGANSTDIDVGTYLYQITVTFEDGSIEKYPEFEDCDDDDDFPNLEILSSLD